ncbi:MAG TPA: YihY/virulence factor BrkB family protein [Solirubrobacteraceae bacterium]|nr:YihY/virulence factor BrkB family protein [Solirubrobacteraceae bacterium]
MESSHVPAGHSRTRRGHRLGGRRRKPHRFGDLPDGAWRRIAKRTFDQYRADGVTNLAAALTYRSILAVFPGLIALVALLGVLGQYPRTFNAVLQIIGGFAPPSTVQTLSGPVRQIITDKGGAGALLGVGLAGAIWAASGYVGTFSWAANVVWEAKRGRSWYRQWPFNLAVTLVALLGVTLVLVGVVLTGPVASSVGRQFGIGSTGIEIWNIGKWPVIVVVVISMISGLYYIAPNVRPPSWRWLTPGAMLAVIAWGVTSIAFGFYVANFGSYNKTYGTLGAVVTFLVWAWLTNIAVLLGIELDSEIERERQLVAHQPGAAEHIQLPLRQE